MPRLRFFPFLQRFFQSFWPVSVFVRVCVCVRERERARERERERAREREKESLHTLGSTVCESERGRIKDAERKV